MKWTGNDISYHDYIKENLTEFKEYTNKYNDKYLINMRYFARGGGWTTYINFRIIVIEMLMQCYKLIIR